MFNKQEVLECVIDDLDNEVIPNSGIPDLKWQDIKCTDEEDIEDGKRYTYLAKMCTASSEFDIELCYQCDEDTIYGEDTREIMQKIRSCLGTKTVSGSSNIFAADGDDLTDAIDDLNDSVDDLQDDVEDFREDDPSVEIDNNIENHYIARCESCEGIFISATVQSDQVIDHITGVCPLCDKETNQYLDWVIKKVNRRDPSIVEDDFIGEYNNTDSYADNFEF